MTMSSSSDEDDNFLRFHAKAIAEALKNQDAAEEARARGASSGGVSSKSQRERLIHDTYTALCYDDPRVESDLACQYLASALLDPKSPYALSGPLVEGIRQLCAKQQNNNKSAAGVSSANSNAGSTTAGQEPLTANSGSTSTAKGSAMLAWAIGAQIPLLCCQASDVSQASTFLGSYRPPPPANPLQSTTTNEDDIQRLINSKQQHMGKEADRLAAMLSQQEEQGSADRGEAAALAEANGNDNEPEEVWAAESDPSDFEFESGFSYEQQVTDFENSFAEWMIDRTDPMKLSKQPAAASSWKQVRHAVMDLISQLNYRQVSSLWDITHGSQTPSDILVQLSMILLIPQSTSSSRQSIFDSPDDEQDVKQAQRQLQAMAWHPLWVLRDAAATTSHFSTLSKYLSLLQNLISIDAANDKQNDSATTSLAPATYVGLASLSALCQQFTSDAESTTTPQQQLVERYRELRRAVWETCDDLAHAMEQEEKIRKASSNSSESSSNDGNWIVWTLLPLFEILANQRLQTGTIIVAKAESAAQRFHNQKQASQQWSAVLLQSGLFRHWLAMCQALRRDERKTESYNLLWQLVRRSLLYMIAQSMPATSALGKYAWRFPSFTSIVEIGESFVVSGDNTEVDDILWNLLAIELAGGVAASGAPTIQWKSTAKNKPSTAFKPLPSRAECQKVSMAGFQNLCEGVAKVLEMACQEENKKENTRDEPGTKAPEGQRKKLEHLLVLKSFQRFVSCLAASPLLSKLFVQDLEPESDGNESTVSKCLGDVQKALSQYKAPSPDLVKGSGPKAKDEDGNEDPEGLATSRKAKDQVQDASLQEEIHMVRKELKVLRSILATKATADAASTVASVPQDLTSSSKTD